ncbi:Fibronectin type III [uncultured Caudovirales phage]|uniref:Fibronectin type III n=1 Tax=uncultured Caudovirales phage TaxID=2100421 RepID=A0A6J5NRC0_9CAUD|nr:Fibronectin type III [uncultured Caudovirales phage]
MAARFPQSGTSLGWRIKPAYSGKVLAIYWPAAADSVHRLYSADTSTTILTRSTSGAGFDATEGLITGDVTGAGGVYFSDSKTGGLGTTEGDSVTYIASYWGDLFNGVSSLWCIGAGAPMDAFSNRMALKAASFSFNFHRPGGNIGDNSAGGSNDVQAYMTVGLRHVVADPVQRYRGWANGAELTGIRTTSAPASSVTVGDASNALRFGGTTTGTGNTRMWGECWIVATDLTDAEMDAITADPSIVIEVAPAAPVLSSPTVVSTGNTIATVRVTTDVAPSGSSTLAVRTRAAAAPAWTASEVLASPTATITSGASGARNFNLTGLTNGTALIADFAQTGPSNVVSTASFTPSTVPGAPTIGTAVAGNASATVAGTAPASTGGATITGYRSTATPGGSTVTGASLPITHTGLTNGTAYTFTLAAQNTRGYGAESAASNSVTPAAPGTAPSITVQPANQTVTAGATATFSVTATGSGLTYQWRRNGTNISGATSSSYTTPATTVSGGSANNGDVYSVVVTGDTAPAATSSNATLTVNAATGPTLPAVATDATGSARRLNQTTRMVVEPFTTIEALGTGARTIATGTTDAVTGEITLTGLASGTYAVFRFFPSTGATIQGVSFRLVVVP